MKEMKISILLMIIALSNCISNLNYSSEIRKLVLNMQKKHQKEWKDQRERSFMEKTVKTAFRSGEREKLNTIGQARTQTAAEAGNSSKEKSEEKSEETAERRSKLKHKFTSQLKMSSKRVATKSKKKSKTETKLIGITFIAILGAMFLVKSIFTYVEGYHKKKTQEVMIGQIKNIKEETFYMKKNEIEACTMSTMMLASNKHIILVYKLKLIYIKAYTEYYRKECLKEHCPSLTKENVIEVEKCKLNEESCERFNNKKFSDNFNEIHKNVELSIMTNMKILKSAKSSACDQRLSYKNFDDKVAELEKEVVKLDDKIAESVDNIAHDGMKTFMNSFLFGLKTQGDPSKSNEWFAGVSYTKTSTTPLQLTELTSYKLARMTYLENPTKATEDIFTSFESAFNKKQGKSSRLLAKFNKIKEESFGEYIKTLSKLVEDEKKNKFVTEINERADKVEEGDDDIFKDKPEIHNHYKNLNFSLTVINFIRMIFSYMLIFDLALGGLGVFNMIEALLEIVSRIITVVMVRIKYNSAKSNPKLSKEVFRKLKREMLNAYAQLAFSIVYLTFFPVSIILKGAYETALKLSDMLSAIRQYKRQIVERNYYNEWTAVKRKHSDLFKNYNICELKFYGYLNIITVLNRIIQDEMEVVKQSRKNSYEELMEALIKTPSSKDYIKNQIIELCSENIQFCSRNISEELLTSLSFTEAEVMDLKTKAIYGPYTTLAIAYTPEEFTSFIDLGYQPITSINYNRKYQFESHKSKPVTDVPKNLKNKPVNAKEDIDSQKEKEKSDSYMLMGCRSCSKNSVIRHIEIFENTEDVDIDNQGPLCNRWRQRNGLGIPPANKNEKICDCIYNDRTCLTAKIKYLRLSSNYVLYYEIIRTKDEVKDNEEIKITKRISYPGLYNIYVWNESQNQQNNYLDITKSNKMFYVKLHIGIWNPTQNNWTTSCKDTICTNEGMHYNFDLNTKELLKTDLAIIQSSSDTIRECPKQEKSNIILPSYFSDYKPQEYNYSEKYIAPVFGNNRKSMCFEYFQYFKTTIKIDFPKVNDASANLKSSWYNWFFYPTENLKYYTNSIEIKNKISLENLEIYSMPKKEVMVFTFEPFKVKTTKLSELEAKLREDAKEVCEKNKPDSYDFKTCPNKALDYNYLTNKSFFKRINEEDKNSFTKLINKQTPKSNTYSFDQDYHTAFVDFGEPLLKLAKEITINPKEEISEFAVDINEFSKEDNRYIIKYTIKKFQPYASFKFFLVDEKSKNESSKLSLKLYAAPEKMKMQPKQQIEFDLNQIHNVIYAVIIKSSYDKNVFTSENKIDPFYNTFLNNNYIMIPILQYQNKQTQNTEDSYKTFIFIKPLPDMGLINNTVYGKTKCLNNFLMSTKKIYLPFLVEEFEWDKFLIEDLLKKSSEKEIVDPKFNSVAKSINFFNHIVLNKNPSEITRPKYHPFQIFDFEKTLNDLLFKKKECTKSDFSFSIPIKFHSNPDEDKSLYYRHLEIDRDNNITESYELAGPDVKEIYWIQFTKKLNLSTDDMKSADKYGYLPYYSFEHNYHEQYTKFLDRTERGWLKSQNDLDHTQTTIQITIWVAYDYRHRYNGEDLCEASKETQRLLDDYDEMLKNMNEDTDVDMEDDVPRTVPTLGRITSSGKSRLS